MKRDGHENITFFVGPEVEHTPAYSKKTLFVIGEQDLNRILELAREHKTPHIFMGANHSFNTAVGWSVDKNSSYWDKTITSLLDRGFWVTLDYPAHQHENVLLMLNKGVWQSRLFVPLLSVRVPNIQTSSPNLTVKIDDIDFKATNPGVWCMHFHEVTDSNRFTDWIEYGTDMVIEEDDRPTPMPPFPPETLKTATKGERINLADLKPATILNARIAKDGSETPVVNVGQLEGGDTFLGSLTAREQEALKDPDVLAGFNMGLDIEAKSSLKADPDEVIAVNVPKIDVLEAYAEGVTSDPLSKEGSKKGTKKK